KEISDAELQDIYYHSYWLASRSSEVYAGLDLELFDESVNSGPATAVRHLQQVLGITADGHIGTQTLDAVHAVKDREALIEEYIERRRAYLKGLRTYWRFGKGWMDRCDGLEHKAIADSRGDMAIPVVEPHPDADTQAASVAKAPQPSPPKPPQVTEAGLATFSITS